MSDTPADGAVTPDPLTAEGHAAPAPPDVPTGWATVPLDNGGTQYEHHTLGYDIEIECDVAGRFVSVNFEVDAAPAPPPDYVDIVFDGPPSHDAPRFIEVENALGHSIAFGKWLQRPDGYWVLRVASGEPPAPPAEKGKTK